MGDGRRAEVGRMEFRLLGPVEVRVGQLRVDLGPAKHQAVVAALLVDCGRVVPVETLVDRVWGDAAPAQSRRTLHSYLARVRGTLRAAAPGATPVLLRRSGGYLLDVDPGAVDLNRFRQLVRPGTGTAEAERAAALGAALDLWRGTPLSGLPGEWAERLRRDLERQRLDAGVEWARCQLRLGAADEILARLPELALLHPLAEPVTELLMRALVRCGRPAEALERYADTRQRLLDELGTEPAPELRELHVSILRGGRGGAAVPPGSGGPEPRPVPGLPVPAQLPGAVRGFTGRDAELSALDDLLAELPPASPTICVLSGTAGVGKTALAVHWGHRSHHRFPDGQLFVDLRGYDPSQPMAPRAALGSLLAAFGVPPATVPDGLAERAARWRTEASRRRRFLLVLDNASTAEQIRPLLPGAGGVVLVTSRDALLGLVALDGARRLRLEPLPPQDAVALLRRLIGPKVDAAPDAAAELARHCAQLPLALRIAAERAAGRAGASLADLTLELADDSERLDLLDLDGDPRAGMRAAFSWSYRSLPADVAGAFRLLGLHPGPAWDAAALAALTGGPTGRARRLLEALDRAHLVHPARPAAGTGRYGMHDLLRQYAAGLVARDDGVAAGRAALTRLLDHYLATAAAAMDLLFPAEGHRRPDAGMPTSVVLADEHAARSWLDAERPTLAAACVLAAERHWSGHAHRIARTVAAYLEVGGHYDTALTLHTATLRAARRDGDSGAEADALHQLGLLRRRLGRYDDAVEHHQRARESYRRAGRPLDEARSANGLGMALVALGRFEEAVAHHEHAITLQRELGERLGEGRSRTNLGVALHKLGRYDQAEVHYRQAFALYQQIGDRFGQATTVANISLVQADLGRRADALVQHHRALALMREVNHPAGEAKTLTNLGNLHASLGRWDQAIECHREALGLLVRIGDRDAVAGTLTSLGGALLGAGRTAEARSAFADALVRADETGEQEERANAHVGLGDAHRALGDEALAAAHWRIALRLYRALGDRRDEEVRDRLTGPGPPTRPGAPGRVGPADGRPLPQVGVGRGTGHRH